VVLSHPPAPTRFGGSGCSDFSINKIYDISRKDYILKNNRIEIHYSTYGAANCFEIIINKDTCCYNLIDGGCDMVMDGIEWTYSANDYSEKLFLYFSKDTGLWRKQNIISSYVVKAGSLLCFNINRICHYDISADTQPKG
jgi:hypothetical protein